MLKADKTMKDVLDATIDYFHKVENEHFKTRKACANAFISLSTLLQNIIENGMTEDILKENAFFNVYEEIMRPFLEIIFSPENKGHENEYLSHMDERVNEIIVHNIIEGLQCGDIQPEDLQQ